MIPFIIAGAVGFGIAKLLEKDTKKFADGGGVGSNMNKRFLDSIDIQYKLKILINISRHYGISIEDAEKEVTDVESEALYEYVTDESLRMKIYNDMKNRRFDDGGDLYSHQLGKYVRAYYNESISNNDNGYQVNLMFYNNQNDDDYFDEEFITTNSPEEAEKLADKINEEGYERFMPKNKYADGGETGRFNPMKNSYLLYEGQSILLKNVPSPKERRFLDKEIVIEKIGNNKILEAFVRETGEKVPFFIDSNLFKIEQYAEGGEAEDESDSIQEQLDFLVQDFSSDEYQAFCYEHDIDEEDAQEMSDFIYSQTNNRCREIIQEIEDGYYAGGVDDMEVDEYAKGGEAGEIKLLSNEFQEAGYDTYARNFGVASFDDEKNINILVSANLLDMYEATGEEEFEEKPFVLILETHAYPEFWSDEYAEQIKDMVGDDTINPRTIDYLYDAHSYGLGVPLSTDAYDMRFNTEEEAIKFLNSKKLNDQISGLGMLSGFHFDKQINRIGDTGWKYLSEQVGANYDEYAKGGKAGEKSIKKPIRKKPIRKKPQPKMVRQYFEDRPYSYAKGGSITKGYNVFNYTDNLYANDEVFKTKKLANDFIKEFRNRYSKQGYYRDSQMNKIDIKDIDLLAIPSNFNPFKKGI